MGRWQNLSHSPDSVSVQGRVLGVRVWHYRHERGWGVLTRHFDLSFGRGRFGPAHAELNFRVGSFQRSIGNKGVHLHRWRDGACRKCGQPRD